MNRAVLDEWAEVVGPERAAGLVSRWSGDLAQRLQELVRLAIEGDKERLRVAVHSLRGAAAGFGLDAFASACARLEEAVLAGACVDPSELAVPASTAIEELRRWLADD